MPAAGTQPSLASTSAPTARRPPITETSVRNGGASSRRGLDQGRSAVGDDLAHRLPDLGRIEAHHQDRVGPHRRRVLDKAVDRMTPRLFKQLGVFADLAADDRAQPGHDVAAEPAAAHNDAKTLALDLDRKSTRLNSS